MPRRSWNQVFDVATTSMLELFWNSKGYGVNLFLSSSNLMTMNSQFKKYVIKFIPGPSCYKDTSQLNFFEFPRFNIQKPCYVKSKCRSRDFYKAWFPYHQYVVFYLVFFYDDNQRDVFPTSNTVRLFNVQQERYSNSFWTAVHILFWAITIASLQWWTCVSITLTQQCIYLTKKKMLHWRREFLLNRHPTCSAKYTKIHSYVMLFLPVFASKVVLILFEKNSFCVLTLGRLSKCKSRR